MAQPRPDGVLRWRIGESGDALWAPPGTSPDARASWRRRGRPRRRGRKMVEVTRSGSEIRTLLGASWRLRHRVYRLRHASRLRVDGPWGTAALVAAVSESTREHLLDGGAHAEPE